MIEIKIILSDAIADINLELLKKTLKEDFRLGEEFAIFRRKL